MDSEYVPSYRPILQVLPFSEADLIYNMRCLPTTKALAPDSLLAIIWQILIPEIAPLIY